MPDHSPRTLHPPKPSTILTKKTWIVREEISKGDVGDNGPGTTRKILGNTGRETSRSKMGSVTPFEHQKSDAS